MGESVAAADVPGGNNLYVAYSGTAAVREVTIVRSGKALAPLRGDGARDVELTAALSDLRAGEWIYVRVVQTDDHAAWSSPIYLR